MARVAHVNVFGSSRTVVALAAVLVPGTRRLTVWGNRSVASQRTNSPGRIPVATSVTYAGRRASGTRASTRWNSSGERSGTRPEIGRASCRERGEIEVGDG